MVNKDLTIISVLFIIIGIACSCTNNNKPVRITSPSGNLAAIITTNANGQIFYEIAKQTGAEETIVVEKSPLGLTCTHADFSSNLELKNTSDPQLKSESYQMISGKQSNLSWSANEVKINFENEKEQELQVVFRIFDEGIAFRYVFPENSGETLTVKSEATGFNIPASANGWMSAYQSATAWGNPGYESDYLAVKSGTPSPEEVGWSFPLLFQSGDNWIFISEADLDSNYCGTHLQQDCTDGLYTVSFPAENERLGDGEVNPSSSLPWEMPWRYILIGDSLNDIVESSMVYHLSKPSVIEDRSWIKSGKASWEWWSSKGGRTVKRLKHFIDFAADMGWEYSLVDAGWENMSDGTIEDVIDYAEKQNVGILMWYNSGGRRDSSALNEEFVLFNDDTREAEMQKLQDWGVKGIKVDFFATDKQFAIREYMDILNDAARHHLLVNFHGCTMPRGWTRTYPNLLAMEAVRGAECYRFSQSYPDIAAEYNTIAAVVRGTAGPTDYTPATFSDNRFPHKTTFGHELALPVIYESGIIHMADTPESYRSLPKEAIDFLKDVPPAWDETKLIKAVPGEIFVVARRKGEKWFIAGINGKNETQQIEFNLPENMKDATLIADGRGASEFKISKVGKQEKSLLVSMMPFGGFVVFQ